MPSGDERLRECRPARPAAPNRPPSSPCCPNYAYGSCGNAGATLESACDESADCAEGERCCSLGRFEGDLDQTECRDRCLVEACVPGSVCPNGNPCAALEDGSGRCPLETAGPTCDGRACKRGEICCWYRDERRGECAARCPDDVGVVAFHCTSPAQCDDAACNVPYSGLTQRYSCGGEGFVSSVLCRTVDDCPAYLPSTGPTVKLVACSHSDAFPPGVQVCVYDHA